MPRNYGKKLENLYAAKSGSNKLFYLTKLVQTKYRDGSSVVDHFNEFQGIVDELHGMGAKLDDELLGLFVLMSLPESWDTLKMSITSIASKAVVNIEDVKGSILNEKMRRKSQSSSQSDVLIADSRGRKQTRSQHQRDKSRGRSKRYANVECHHCKKKGHIKKFCRKFKNEQERTSGKEEKKGDNNDDERAAITTDEFQVLHDDEVVNLATHETSWVIDSGASIHTTSRIEFFSSYKPGEFGVVRMGNDESIKIAGIGDVYLETEIGTRLVLKDVRRVQDIHLNLISTGRVDDEGFCSTLKNGQCKLTKGSLVVVKGKKYSTLYLLQAELSKYTVNVMEKDDANELWHRRLGHMGEKGMTQLARRNILSGIDKVHLKNCVDCLAGK